MAVTISPGLQSLPSSLPAPQNAPPADPPNPETPKPNPDFVDVSHVNTPVDFDKYAASGKKLAILKVSEGGDWKDPAAPGYRAALTRLGLFCGLYHFAGASLSGKINPPDQEADFFLSQISPLGPKEFPVLDFEKPYKMTPEQQTDWVGKWCARVEEKTGKAPWVYSYTDMVGGWGDHAKTLTHFPLWLSDFTQGHDRDKPPSSQAWPTLEAWQYTDKGSFEGIPKADASFLYQPLAPTPVPPSPPPAPGPTFQDR